MNELYDLPDYDEVGPLTQLTLRYEQSRKVLWVMMNAAPRPCFNPTILAELLRTGESLAKASVPIDFIVLGSTSRGIFNTGGDLALFHEKITQAAVDALRRYALSCVRATHGVITGFGTQTITIAMVEGTALGGGLEAALAHHFVLAGRDAKMGFPEIAFNLFPGMGASSVLHRKASPAVAQELMMSGEAHTAEWMLEKGLIDRVFEPSEGVRAVRTFIDTLVPRLNGVRGIIAARQRVDGVSLQELIDVTNLWVDHAMTLEPKDLSYITRLVNAQSRLAKATVSA